MKIVFLCRLFYPHIGGVEKHVMEISKILVKKGHEVIVITEGMDVFLHRDEKKKKWIDSKIENINGITVYRISAGREDKFKKFRIWKEMWLLRRIIEEADIIHCHDVFYWYLPFRFLYPQKPVFTTFHGYESFPIRKGAIAARKVAEKLSKGNIIIGDFIKKWYGTKPTYVSYGAVDISQFKNHNEKDKNDSAIFIGRLDEQTGILTYAKSIEFLKKKYPKFVFTIVGDGRYRDSLEKKFSVLGFQENPGKYLSQHHFAFVSRYLSILEAFAARKFVFAVYDNPVKEDYLTMAPFAKWIVIERDPTKLAKKIDYYLKNSNEEKKLIEQSYEWVKKQSWENMVSLYLKLWKENSK